MSTIKAPQTIGDIVRHHATERPGSIAFEFEGTTTSYLELDRGSNRAANTLKAAGVNRGDRVAYLGKNTDAYFEVLIGAAKIGAVMVPVNWRLAQPEVVYVVNDCEAKILFVGEGFEKTASAIAGSVPGLDAILGIDVSIDDQPHYLAWREQASERDQHVEVSVNEDAIQLYTSGTTGKPKGAVLTHSSLFPDAIGEVDESTQFDWEKTSDGEVALVAMPCFHISGTGFGLSSLFNGTHAIILPEYDPTQALELIEKFAISKIFMVPAAIQILLDHPRAGEVDFNKLRYIFYGASPIPLDLMKRAMDALGCGFVQMYGMTETSGTIVALNPEDHVPEGSQKMQSVGTPLTDVEIKIVDGDGKTLGPGEIGEIVTRSPKNMTRYWNKPEATAETIDTAGWLRTGDAGYLDEDGYLYIRDRMKDLIISGGENVYPAEVEAAIREHPAVEDVAVIGVPSKKWGEEVKACVVKKPDAQLDEAQLIAHARQQIAGYKCPKSADFLENLPRNAAGKVLKKELREPYWDGLERSVN